VRSLELFGLFGKTAIVTGGGSGIGRQMAEGLAEAGANLVLCARRVERCEAAAEELQLLAEAELADGAIRDGPLLVVGAARLALDLVRPLRAHLGELALGPSPRQLVGRRSGLRQVQLGTGAPETSDRGRFTGPT